MTRMRGLVIAVSLVACGDFSRGDDRPSPTDNVPNVLDLPQDMENPVLSAGDPAPGKLVLQSLPAYTGTEVQHALYLPTDWAPGKRFPVIIEYRGNTSRVKDPGGLGYGLSGGKGFIWAVLPFVGLDHKADTNWWWGDVEATIAYAKEAVPAICRQWGGDPEKVILTGHSRGAIACNYIGLHDDEIAKLWCAMMPISHYDDGHTKWGMTIKEQARAPERLRRLGNTPQYICGEHHLSVKHNDAKLLETVAAGKFKTFEEAKKSLGLVSMIDAERTRQFVMNNYPQGRFTIVDLPYINHSAGYVLRDIPERKQMRDWIQNVLNEKNRQAIKH